jgi:hypothetical protein
LEEMAGRVKWVNEENRDFGVPMPEQTMVLREVARQLALSKNKKAKGIDSAALRGLLRAGELQAGFYILDGAAWIDIPVDYWLKTDAPRMSKITRKGGESYKLRPSKFPDQVAKIISNLLRQREPSSDQSVISADLVALVSSIGLSYEVTVKTAVFNDHLRRHNIVMPTVAVSKGGRPQKLSWPKLCSYVGAYFAAHCRDFPGRPIEIEATSKIILELADKDGIGDLPDWQTLKEHVSTAVQLLQSSRFDLKT